MNYLNSESTYKEFNNELQFLENVAFNYEFADDITERLSVDCYLLITVFCIYVAAQLESSYESASARA